jgi:hypothetical protein
MRKSAYGVEGVGDGARLGELPLPIVEAGDGPSREGQPVRGVVGIRQALGGKLHAKGLGRYDLPAAPVPAVGEPVARNPCLRHGERPVGLIVGVGGLNAVKARAARKVPCRIVGGARLGLDSPRSGVHDKACAHPTRLMTEWQSRILEEPRSSGLALSLSFPMGFPLMTPLIGSFP